MSFLSTGIEVMHMMTINIFTFWPSFWLDLPKRCNFHFAVLSHCPLVGSSVKGPFAFEWSFPDVQTVWYLGCHAYDPSTGAGQSALQSGLGKIYCSAHKSHHSEGDTWWRQWRPSLSWWYLGRSDGLKTSFASPSVCTQFADPQIISNLEGIGGIQFQEKRNGHLLLLCTLSSRASSFCVLHLDGEHSDNRRSGQQVWWSEQFLVLPLGRKLPWLIQQYSSEPELLVSLSWLNVTSGWCGLVTTVEV